MLPFRKKKKNRWRYLLHWYNAFSALDVMRAMIDYSMFFYTDFLRFIALNAIGLIF